MSDAQDFADKYQSGTERGGTAGYVRMRGEPVARLFRALQCIGCQAECEGVVWWFEGGLRLYLADRPATPELPFELSVLPPRGGGLRHGGIDVTTDQSSEQQGDTAHNPADSARISRKAE